MVRLLIGLSMMLTWTRPNADTIDETANVFETEHASKRFKESM
ncbi:MAG: hypothetical protein WCE81_01690 [Halobacteriota archaeon]